MQKPPTYETWWWDSIGPIARKILRPGTPIELIATWWFQWQRTETPSAPSPSSAKWSKWLWWCEKLHYGPWPSSHQCPTLQWRHRHILLAVHGCCLKHSKTITKKGFLMLSATKWRRETCINYQYQLSSTTKLLKSLFDLDFPWSKASHACVSFPQGHKGIQRLHSSARIVIMLRHKAEYRLNHQKPPWRCKADQKGME